MVKIEFPRLLKQLLEESDLQAPLQAFVNKVALILSDNQLPFFPDYTDHSIEHVNRVLQFEVDELVPQEVWENSRKDSKPRLFGGADAVVLIGATLLHDIAMHLREKGFLELVSPDSRFQPLPWFKDAYEDHAADRPWHELWEEYVREAKRMSERKLAKVIGEESARYWKFECLPEDIGKWELNHRLLIGEFIRRHHARLAHEIAMYGFPGLPVGSSEHQFPAMGMEKGHSLQRFADLIGVTARSHGMNLRTCKSYLDCNYSGTPQPQGTAALYHMALLRVADYFQIDRQRAPSVLLQLRHPQSPVSVQEWQKHLAVQYIGSATDPRGKMITVSDDVSLSLYLQLQELLKGLQNELDHSTAVLDESYGRMSDLGLDLINLKIRRIHSNLNDPKFRDNLPYVPERTGFRVDPNLLTLLVEPLYGNNPSVGVRELMQNAVDAVCELDAWSKAHGVALESLDLPEQDGDVLIEFIEQENSTWFLRVRDRGIGMTSDTIKNYFLRAGASFRNSEEWIKEFVGDDGKPRVARAGRFGIGAFAIFLLGHSFRLWTRHVGADNSSGYMIEASADSQLIEIQRVDNLLIGTTVEVEMTDKTAKAFVFKKDIGVSGLIMKGLSRLFQKDYSSANADWFCWNWPVVLQRIVRGANTALLKQEYVLPVRRIELPTEWFVIHPKGFDAVYWTFGDAPPLSCNGLRIETRKSSPEIFREPEFEWPEEIQLKSPCIAVIDSNANLPLTIQRYELSQQTLPFINELTRDVMLSFIAHALVCGPTSYIEAISSLKQRHPLCRKPIFSGQILNEETCVFPFFSEGLSRWCLTSNEMVPADTWLYSLLQAKSYFVYGVLVFDEHKIDTHYSGLMSKPLIKKMIATGNAVLPWPFALSFVHDNDRYKALGLSPKLRDTLASDGVVALGHKVQASRVIVLAKNEFVPKRTSSDEKSAVRRPLNLTQFNGGKGSFEESIPLEDLLGTMYKKYMPRWNMICLYVAEITTGHVECKPESLIAKLWHECLGARAIPFDPVAREALIADGCKHPELKRHIEAWQEMKRTGSKWVTGETDTSQMLTHVTS